MDVYCICVYSRQGMIYKCTMMGYNIGEAVYIWKILMYIYYDGVYHVTNDENLSVWEC